MAVGSSIFIYLKSHNGRNVIFGDNGKGKIIGKGHLVNHIQLKMCEGILMLVRANYIFN